MEDSLHVPADNIANIDKDKIQNAERQDKEALQSVRMEDSVPEDIPDNCKDPGPGKAALYH